MANIDESLQELMTLDGIMAACVADYQSGMILGSTGSGIDIELAAAGKAQALKAKIATMKMLGLRGDVHDILITMDTQLHILRPTAKHEDLFIYLVLDKPKSNLALARRKVQAVESTLQV